MSDIDPRNPSQPPDHFSESGQTMISRHPQITDPISSKHVCFYKSGDPQFSGLKMVINNRTFKSFDALLDTLSKKVPLPFGVRNITTPRGIHGINHLDELEDGKSYICSDQKKVKPIDLDVASKKPVPWYTTRPVSARRRAVHLARQNDSRIMKRENSLVVRTPKKLVVFKNGDSGIKNTIMLQKKTSQTFESLLGHVTEVMQFPVVKLYTPDGRRVDSLQSLILCSGVVVASGREPFKPGSYDPQTQTLPAKLPGVSSHVQPKHRERLGRRNRKKKSVSSTRSRNFSLSSEKYFVNQINGSIAGSLYDMPIPSNTMESAETCTCVEEDIPVMPLDEDIEKSFRVNQDGSMTVEMKVRLTIKQEETIQWTTTLSRSSVSNQINVACISHPEPGGSSSNPNLVAATELTCATEYTSKEENDLSQKGTNQTSQEGRDEKVPAFRETQEHDFWQDLALNKHDTESKDKVFFRRPPTPGPRRTKKKQTSLESLKTVLEKEIEENVVGTYAYIEETENGDVKKEYCMVSQCSSRPIPKPRKTGSVEINNNDVHSSVKSSGVANILKLHDNGEEITETVLHIVEHQSCHDNFFANLKCGLEGKFTCGRPASSDLTLCSLGNEYEVHYKRPSTASESLNGRKNGNTSFSSDLMINSYTSRNDLSSVRNDETGFSVNLLSKALPPKTECSEFSSGGYTKDHVSPSIQGKKNKQVKPKVKKINVPTNVSSYSKGREKKDMTSQKDTRKAISDILTSGEKQIKHTEESPSNFQQVNKIKKSNKKKKGMEEENINSFSVLSLSENAYALNIENTKGLMAEKELNYSEVKSIKDNQMVCLNGSEEHTCFKKIVLPPIDSSGQDKMRQKKQKKTEQNSSEKETRELSENASLLELYSSPSLVNEKVENWLENLQSGSKSSQGNVSHNEADTDNKVIFQIGSDPSEESEVTGETKENHTEYLHAGKINTIKRQIESVSKMEKLEEASDEDSNKKQSLHDSIPNTETNPIALTQQRKTQKTTEAAIQTEFGEICGNSPSQPDLKPVLEQLCCSVKSIQKQQHKTQKTTEAAIQTEFGEICGNSPSQPDLKPVLEQLCCSVKSIQKQQTSNSKRFSSLEKSSSLPDLSSNVVSTLGASSKVILAFLSVLALREGITDMDNTVVLTKNRSSTEALKLMESLKKMASVETEGELTIGLSDSQQTTSSHLLHPCSDHQEITGKGKSHDFLAAFSETNTLLEAYTDENHKNMDHPFDIQDSIAEPGIPEELQTEELAPVDKQSKEVNIKEEQNHKSEEIHCYDESIHQDETSLNGELSSNEPSCLLTEEIPHREEFTAFKEASYVEEQLGSANDELQMSQSGGIKEAKHISFEQKADEEFMGENLDGCLTNDNGYAKEHSSSVSIAKDILNDERKKPGIAESVKSVDDMVESSSKDSLCSSLSFSYDSKIAMKKETGGVNIKSIKEMFMAKSTQDLQYRKKRLPSPSTSDLSDYRPETSDSSGSGYRSQASCELTTESGEDISGRQSISKGYVRKTIERLYGTNEAKVLSVTRPPAAPKQKHKESPGENSTGCISSPVHTKPKATSDLLYFNAKSSLDLNNKSKQSSPNTALSDPNDGVLIDKGRWLLKENHLIRKSPPEKLGMYGNIETTSAETGLDNTSEDAPYSYFGSHHPPLAVISSSELEELAKPGEPKCTYFNMPHASDSEPFPDDMSIKSKGSLLCRGAVDGSNKKKDLHSLDPSGEPTKMWAEKNGSLPSFASVEFRLPDNKVHPEQGPSVAHPVISQPARAGSTNGRSLEEQDSLEKLHIMCGQHCPILTVKVEPLHEENRGYVYQKPSDLENEWIMRSLKTGPSICPRVFPDTIMKDTQMDEEHMDKMIYEITKIFEDDIIRQDIAKVKQELSSRVISKQVKDAKEGSAAFKIIFKSNERQKKHLAQEYGKKSRFTYVHYENNSIIKDLPECCYSAKDCYRVWLANKRNGSIESAHCGRLHNIFKSELLQDDENTENGKPSAVSEVSDILIETPANKTQTAEQEDNEGNERKKEK